MKRLLERIVIFSLLFLVMGAFSALFFGADLREESVNPDTSHLGLSVIEFLIYFGCAAFSAMHYRRMLVSLRAAWPFLLLSLTAVLSTIWSVDPGTTLRRSGVLLGTTVFGVYLGGRYSTEEFQRVLLQSLFVLVGVSIVFLLIFPVMVLDPSHTGTFRGLTEHKNYFGEFMGILLLLAFTFRFRAGRWLPRLTLIFVAGSLLVAAHSATAVLSAAFTILVLPILRLLRFRKRQAVPLTAIGLGLLTYVVVLVYGAADTFLGALGKDRTLTGRSEVWALVWQAILRRPFLGYGYDAFWQGTRGESSRVLSGIGWNVAHSHNGYLEALLGFGCIGSCVIIFALFRFCEDALLYVRQEKSVAGLWPFAFLFFYLVHAVAEASLVKRDGFSYLLIVAVSTSLSMRRAEQKVVHEREWRANSIPEAEVLVASPRPLYGD
jgi:exopolysaccharide production protein ExoQ